MIHLIYKIVGHVVCKMLLLFFGVRDRVYPPKEKDILFVSHPDDDALFFHMYIKENKPYVVLMTTGWSLRRLYSFAKMMKYYGVRFRAYDLQTRDKRVKLIKKIIRHMLHIGEFKTCATHNSNGEYGHEMHKRLHECVLAESFIPVYCPMLEKRIIDFPLTKTDINEKRWIFQTIYSSECFVLNQYKIWLENEQLERCI